MESHQLVHGSTNEASLSRADAVYEPVRRTPYRGGRVGTERGPRCAWVTLLMLGKAYAPGVLAVAQSLRDVRTKHSLVCMVTDDVPAETREQLALVYDRVEQVPYIKHDTARFESARQAEMYKGWIDRSFTKWNCLALTSFDRVAFVDADMIVVANIDDLFELRPPAATFSSPYAYPWQRPGGIPNPYLGSGGECPPDAEPAACELPHGARIPASTILAAAKEGSFVGAAVLVVLAPSLADYEGLRQLIDRAPVFGEGYTRKSGADEVALALYYAGRGVDWTNIHQRYQAIPWKKNWVSRDIRAFHYLGRKPWDQDPDEWPDLADWWRVAKQLVQKYPALREVFFPVATGVTPSTPTPRSTGSRPTSAPTSWPS